MNVYARKGEAACPSTLPHDKDRIGSLRGRNLSRTPRLGHAVSRLLVPKGLASELRTPDGSLSPNHHGCNGNLVIVIPSVLPEISVCATLQEKKMWVQLMSEVSFTGSFHPSLTAGVRAEVTHSCGVLTVNKGS